MGINAVVCSNAKGIKQSDPGALPDRGLHCPDGSTKELDNPDRSPCPPTNHTAKRQGPQILGPSVQLPGIVWPMAREAHGTYNQKNFSTLDDPESPFPRVTRPTHISLLCYILHWFILAALNRALLRSLRKGLRLVVLSSGLRETQCHWQGAKTP